MDASPQTQQYRSAISQFIVRFPGDMREEVKQMAAVNRRSMNAEIILHLERALLAHKKGAENEERV